MPEGNPEREARILDAAARLIERYGYDKTSVEDIAREAGISKGAIYLHFKSKDALFEALLLRESDVIVTRFYELLDADPGGPTLFNLYRYGLVVLDASPLLKAIFTRDRRVLGDYARRLKDAPGYVQEYGLTVDFVRYYQQAGLIRDDLDPVAVTYLLSALRYGILTMEDYTPNVSLPSVAQLSDTLAEMLSNGLAPRDGAGNKEAARQALEKLAESRLQFMEQRRKQQP